MELDGLIGLHRDEDTSSDLDEASQWRRHSGFDGDSTPYMNGRATTRGVFKAYVFFFVILLALGIVK